MVVGKVSFASKYLLRSAKGSLQPKDASALMAYMIGSLVYGAFAPRKTAGFAAPGAKKIIDQLMNNQAK
ncbi:MAG: hypothetical protein HRU09_13435 [Oligoflexales bacterium]|nr:hypothetical protein [Oligoflexales bacterium]